MCMPMLSDSAWLASFVRVLDAVVHSMCRILLQAVAETTLLLLAKDIPRVEAQAI